PCPRGLLHSFPTRRSSDLALSMYLDDREFTYESKPLLFRDYFPYRNILPGERNITIFQASSSSKPVELYAAKESFKPGVLYSILDRKSTRLNSSHVSISYA